MTRTKEPLTPLPKAAERLFLRQTFDAMIGGGVMLEKRQAESKAKRASRHKGNGI